MQLLAPIALALAALALVVLAFHIRRRRTIAVPSLVIWRQLGAGQIKRNRVLQWPQPSWALLLQLIAVLALVGALAQPLLNRGEAVDHWIFVLDRSGPIQAQRGDETLLAAAQAQLKQRVADAAGGGKFSLIANGLRADPIVARRPFDDPGLPAAIASVRAEDGPADWSDIAAILRPLVVAGETSRVVLYSDRDTALPLSDLGADVTQQTITLAPDRRNAALTAQMAPDAKAPAKWIVSGTVRLDPGLASAELVVSYAGNGRERPLEWTRRTIGNATAAPASQSAERKFSVPLELPGPGIVSVSLTGDGNGYDNHARFVIGPAATSLDILYVGAGDQPLLNALKAIEGSAIYQAPGLPADVSQFALVVVDNQHVARQPETNVLWIGDAGVAGDPLPALGALSATGAVSDHPLMRNLAWSGLSARSGFALAPSEGAEVLLRAGDQAMVTIAHLPTGTDVALAFDPRESVWPQQPGLPIFAANLVRWLGIAPQSALQQGCMVGQSCQLDARFEGGSLTRIDGDDAAVSVIRGGRVQLGEAGLYEASKGNRRQLLAVNPIIATTAPVALASVPSDAPLPLWPFLIGLAALALIAEAIVSGRGGERFLHLDGLRSSNPLSTRRRVTLGLRVATLALTIAAVANLPMPFRQSGETLVQVLAPGGEPLADSHAIVAAGDSPDLAGDAAAAIELAAASVPWGEPGHILVSGATAGDRDRLLGLSDELAARDIVLDMAMSDRPIDPVVVTALEAPEPVFAGDTFQLVGIVRAEADVSAKLRFERNGETLVEQSVALVAGDNRVETILSDVAEGLAHYTLSVTSDADPLAEANALTRIIEARAAGQVAVIANDPQRAATFVDWLASQDVDGIALEPKAAPYTQKDWKAYDGAVLLDVPAIALTILQQEQLEKAVAEQGLGLLILGGPNSFGPGGYLETPLDRMSPLSSRVPRDAPEATLVFVLDRSGSMQQPVGNGTRLDIAKQATLAAIRLLNRNSQVGIIVFDSEPTAVLPLARIDNPDVVATALGNVDPGGGTSVYPGLQAAFDMLKSVDTPARHIIVMTDGLSQPADFPGLLGEIRAQGITVSSVSIGQGAERKLIEQIARLGGGTFHATDDFAALPSILSQEAMLLSGSPVEEGRTQPLWAARNEPFLRGLPERMPPIDGFVLTTAKPEAELSMAVPDTKGEPMPLLASWRFGAGQVLALTTEAVGPWSAQWQQMDSYAALWAQTVRQFLPGVEKGDLVLDLVRRGDGFVAELVLQGTGAGLEPELVMTGPDGAGVPLALTRTGLDRYEAQGFADLSGTYRFAASAGDLTTEKSVAMSYPLHQGNALPDQGMRQLAVLSGGRPDVTEPVLRNLPDRWSLRPFWPFWLGLALLLLMAELTVRYTRILAPRKGRQALPPSRSEAEMRAPAAEPVHTS